jgi:hypothetical protein
MGGFIACLYAKDNVPIERGSKSVKKATLLTV